MINLEKNVLRADTKVHPLTLAPNVQIKNPDLTVRDRPLGRTYFHDMRTHGRNETLDSYVENARQKVCPADDKIFFADEFACEATNVYADNKIAFADGEMVHVTGNLTKTQDQYATNADVRDLINGRIRDAEQLPGRSVHFHGLGSTENFYHWTVEKFPRLALLAAHEDLASIDNVVIMSRDDHPFFRQSLELFYGPLAGKLKIVTKPVVCERMVFFADRTIGSLGNQHLTDQILARTEGRGAIWGSLLHHIDRISGMAWPDPSNDPKSIVISRRKAQVRKWLNEADFLNHAASIGVAEVTSETMPFSAQARLFRNARVVIAQHGAGLSNAVFCRPGASIIEVTSRVHVRRAFDFAKLSVARGLNHHIVLVDAQADRDPSITGPDSPDYLRPPVGDIHAAPEAISSILDLIRGGLDDHEAAA